MRNSENIQIPRRNMCPAGLQVKFLKENVSCPTSLGASTSELGVQKGGICI